MLNATQQDLCFIPGASRPLTPAPSATSSRADELPRDFLRIIGYLGRCCRGPGNAATASAIASALAIGANDGRKVRNLLSMHYRDLPFVVCGAGGSGYYVRTDPEQLTHERRSLYSRLTCIARRISDLDHVARRDGFTRHGAGHHVSYEGHPTNKEDRNK